jgi:hypothetical protein
MVSQVYENSIYELLYHNNEAGVWFCGYSALEMNKNRQKAQRYE